MIKLSPNNPIVRHFSHRTIRLGHPDVGIMGDTSLFELRKILKARESELAETSTVLGNFGTELTGEKGRWKQRVKISIPAKQAYYDDFYQRALGELEEKGWQLRKPLANFINKWINI